jgi:hypothetical protein
MIIKASQRAGANQLGQHLLRVDDNDHVEIREIRGVASDDVIGAMREAYAISRSTKCKQFLFSVSFSRDAKEPRTSGSDHGTGSNTSPARTCYSPTRKLRIGRWRRAVSSTGSAYLCKRSGPIHACRYRIISIAILFVFISL